ncbi:fibroblast growth factor-binding protein 1-like [Limanda limanda]|uniref:fibroblast growth factor-binding protein 1-like n=1 Tax=Limanda limanda TaxID=27771 RepID=UPI0029C68EB4|nr:fibroblast growth factor-binding protein 1-like [Limanda limanda]
MLLLRTLAAGMLLALLGHQVSADRPVHPPGPRAHRSGQDKGDATGRGKFTLKDKTPCTWGSRDSGRGVRLSVRCENPAGTSSMECKYNGKPQSCPGYTSNPKGFWKQVARAFKRLQDKVCKDQGSLVRAGMCKRAPRDAHFKLDPSSVVVSSQGADPKTTAAPRTTTISTTTTIISTSTSNSTSTGPDCTKHRKTAEEYCSSSWASVCSFLFSMVQTDDC